MNEKPLIIFSGKAFLLSAKRLKWVVVGLPLLLGALFSGIHSLLPTEYESSVVLAPSEERTGGLAEIAGGLSGIAGLAGINLGGNRVDNTQLALEILESRTFLYMLTEKYDLMPYLLAVEDWDKEQQEPIFDEDIYNPSTQKWMREGAPQIWEAYGPLREATVIENDRTTRILRLGIRHVDPYFATRLIGIIVDELNTYIRLRDKERIQQQINYLTDVASTAQQAEVRESLLYLLQEQFKRAMLIEANDDYVYEVIDPAVVPHKPAGFSSLVLFIIGIIIGAFTAIGLVVLNAYRYTND